MDKALVQSFYGARWQRHSRQPLRVTHTSTASGRQRQGRSGHCWAVVRDGAEVVEAAGALVGRAVVGRTVAVVLGCVVRYGAVVRGRSHRHCSQPSSWNQTWTDPGRQLQGRSAHRVVVVGLVVVVVRGATVVGATVSKSSMPLTFGGSAEPLSKNSMVRTPS